MQHFLGFALCASPLWAADFSHAQICHADGLRNCLYYAPDSANPADATIKLAPPNRTELSEFYFYYDKKIGIMKNEAGYCIKYNPMVFHSSDKQFSLAADRKCESVNTTTWTFQDQVRGVDYATVRPYKKIDSNENTLYELYERRPKLCLTVKSNSLETEIVLIDCVNDYALLPMKPAASQRFFAVEPRMGTQSRSLLDSEIKSIHIAPWHTP